MTVKAETTYEDGQLEKEFPIDIEAPPEAAEGEDALGDWGNDYLLEHAIGDGKHQNSNGLYEVTILECSDRPDLVGYTATGQG
ncbi:hypothetical protein [Tsukamurella tyrosinosolvens]|nr:hypothetical protein [Tsukamurella tyrosinosolvens]